MARLSGTFDKNNPEYKWDNTTGTSNGGVMQPGKFYLSGAVNNLPLDPMNPGNPGTGSGQLNPSPPKPGEPGFIGPMPIPGYTPPAPPAGGGNGGGGNPPAPSGNQDPHINPATGQWDDNYYAQTHPSGGGNGDSTGQVELEQALAEYDRNAEELQAQSGQLDTQRAGALSTIDTEQQRALSESNKAKEEARLGTVSAKNKALSTAQDVQRSNRNILRALGILSSSAGGDILAKPMNEYGKQAGELEQGLVKRIGVVEDWLMQRQQDFTKAKTDIEQQYATLKDNISRDLRFNSRQRVLAVKAAAAAAQQRIQEAQRQQQQFQQTARQYSDNMLLEIAKIKMYQNPSADVSAIISKLLSSTQTNQQPKQGLLGANVVPPIKKDQNGNPIYGQ